MSGGSYNYLCSADADNIHEKLRDLSKMRDRLMELGHKDIAKETEGLILMIEAYRIRVDVRIERMNAVWKAVEWYDSGDWSMEDVDEEMEKYKCT